jgi:hypothetical protein
MVLSLVCKGGQLTGISADLVASVTDTGSWQQVSLPAFTPTQKGVVEIEVQAYGNTYTGYVDDLTVTQAA